MSGRRERDQILNLLAQIHARGFVTVPRVILAQLYGNEKFTKSIRSSFHDDWHTEYNDKVDLRFASIDFEATILIVNENAFWKKEDC